MWIGNPFYAKWFLNPRTYLYYLLIIKNLYIIDDVVMNTVVKR